MYSYLIWEKLLELILAVLSVFYLRNYPEFFFTNKTLVILMLT